MTGAGAEADAQVEGVQWLPSTLLVGRGILFAAPPVRLSLLSSLPLSLSLPLALSLSLFSVYTLPSSSSPPRHAAPPPLPLPLSPPSLSASPPLPSLASFFAPAPAAWKSGFLILF